MNRILIVNGNYLRVFVCRCFVQVDIYVEFCVRDYLVYLYIVVLLDKFLVFVVFFIRGIFILQGQFGFDDVVNESIILFFESFCINVNGEEMVGWVFSCDGLEKVNYEGGLRVLIFGNFI